MNRHRDARLTTRNWDALVEMDEDGLPHFEKLRRSDKKDRDADRGVEAAKRNKPPRQRFD